MRLRGAAAGAVFLLLSLVGARSASAQEGPAPGPTPEAPLLAPAPESAPPPSAPLLPAPDPRVDRLEAHASTTDGRLAEDEQRLEKLEKAGGGLWKNLALQGYVQVQFLTQSFDAAASPNVINGKLPEGVSANDVIARENGLTTNTTLFRLRRTRLRVKYELDFMRLFVQIDPLPSGGPSAPQGTVARNAEATGIARWSKNVRTEFGAGLFEVPMRFELLESSMYRPFVERSWLAQSLFPTERDLGFHAKTIINEKIIIEGGILNGQRLGEPRFVELPDFGRSKDFFLRAAGTIGPLTLGAFGYAGNGQVVDAKELKVKHYTRWGVNFGATFAKKLVPLGETRVYTELFFGMNMDTGVRYAFALPAIPKNFTDDVTNLHERGLYVRAEQDFGENFFAGYRFDTYTPNDQLATNARDTHTVMTGLRFTKHLRIVNELAAIIDNVHPAGSSPAGKHIYQESLWMQASFY